MKSTGHMGGWDHRRAKLVQASYCARYRPGNTYTWDRTEAITWGGGTKLEGVIGIDLQSRTGFTTKAKTQIKVKDKKVRICGYRDFPGGTPRQLVSKPR